MEFEHFIQKYRVEAFWVGILRAAVGTFSRSEADWLAAYSSATGGTLTVPAPLAQQIVQVTSDFVSEAEASNRGYSLSGLASSLGISTTGLNATQVAQAVAERTERRDPLANFKRGGMAGKTIAVVGDSTSDFAGNAGSLNTALQILTANGEPLEGCAAFLNYGSSGLTASGFSTTGSNTTGKNLGALIQAAPDGIVLSFGINDVRTGGSTTAQLEASLTSIVDQIRAGLPSADIVLRMPNTLCNSETDGAGGFISPDASAPDYSNRMRDAYRALAHRWPNVILMDTQKTIFGETSGPLASSPWMSDTIHPTTSAYASIAAEIGRLFTTQPGYSAIRASYARQASPTADWTQYGLAAEDVDYYDLVAEAGLQAYSSASGNILDFYWLGHRAFELAVGDVVVIGRRTEHSFLITTGTNIYDQTSRTRLLSFNGGIAFTGTPGGTVRVFRPKYGRDSLGNIKKYWDSHTAYPYRWRGYVTGGGAGFVDLRAYGLERLAKDRTATVATDTLIIAGSSPLVLTGATFAATGDNLRVTVAGTYSGLAGTLFGVFGNHVYEDGSRRRVVDGSLKHLQAN